MDEEISSVLNVKKPVNLVSILIKLVAILITLLIGYLA